MDPKNFGFIDFDSLLTFMSKYNSEIDAKKINAILRRFNDNTEFKITYR
jgi:Ca2+-binding EF-hand superfamily protein